MTKFLVKQEQNKKKRQYFRKCGFCNNRYEQSDMVRTNKSPNGWSCKHCYLSTLDLYNHSYVSYHESMDYITSHDNDIW